MLRREGIAREPVDDEAVIAELVDDVARRVGSRELDLLINDCCFVEEKRLRGTKDPEELAYRDRLREVRRRLAWASDAELNDLLRELIELYAREIHGHFDARTYANATKVLPRGLALLLKNQKPWLMLRQGLRGNFTLADRIVTSGQTATFDKLVELGTVVLVPTHLSNLDSPVIGFALHQAGLPPMIYGAGKNLFSNWLLSYFMDHLGAYKVDRLKKQALYKEVLKGYSRVALRHRWHSLFFPGGTRSRSGEVEVKLKKGLMGTALEAYQDNLRAGSPRPRLFFIPTTINYHLVLEAETLIDDHLQESGKSRYIISDDEFSKPDRVLNFVRSMMAMENPVEVVFGRPLDPFGNFVDDEGNSLDPHGRPFDPRGYVESGGQVVADAARDREYTGRLGDAIGQAFLRDTVLFHTHVLAAALMRRMRAHHPHLDLYRRLLLGVDARRFPIQEVDAEVRLLQESLMALAERGEVRLGADVVGVTPAELRATALKAFGRYHNERAATEREGVVIVQDARLTLYYANRLEHYPLPAPLPPGGAR